MVSSNRGRVTRVNYSGQQHSKAPQSNKTVFNLIYIVAIGVIFFEIIYGFPGGDGQTSATVSSSSSTLPKPPSSPTYNTPIVRSEDSPDDEGTGGATQDPTEQDSEQETDSDTEKEDDTDDAGESVDGPDDASLDLDPTTVTPPADHDDAPDTDD
jgi:hypothetical protein